MQAPVEKGLEISGNCSQLVFHIATIPVTVFLSSQILSFKFSYADSLRNNGLCDLDVYQRTPTELCDRSGRLAIVNYQFLKSFSFLKFLPQTQVIVTKKQATQAWAKSLKDYRVKMSSIMYIVLEYPEQKVSCASVLSTHLNILLKALVIKIFIKKREKINKVKHWTTVG